MLFRNIKKILLFYLTYSFRSRRKRSVSLVTVVVPQVLLEGCLNLCYEDQVSKIYHLLTTKAIVQ